MLELDAVLVQELGAGEDRGVCAHRQGQGIGGARVQVYLAAVFDDGEQGVERALLQLRDRDARDLALDGLEQHDGLLADHVEADAVDDHALNVHGLSIRAACRVVIIVDRFGDGSVAAPRRAYRVGGRESELEARRAIRPAAGRRLTLPGGLTKLSDPQWAHSSVG